VGRVRKNTGVNSIGEYPLIQTLKSSDKKIPSYNYYVSFLIPNNISLTTGMLLVVNLLNFCKCDLNK